MLNITQQRQRRGPGANWTGGVTDWAEVKDGIPMVTAARLSPTDTPNFKQVLEKKLDSCITRDTK